MQMLSCPGDATTFYCHKILPIQCHLMANCGYMNSSAFNYWVSESCCHY